MSRDPESREPRDRQESRQRLWRRLDRSVGRPIDQDVDRELAFHLEERARELMTMGWSESAAHEEARRLFGDEDRIAEQCRSLTRETRRATDRAWRLDRLRSDVIYALRRARREPGFTAMALLTLALGIGANTAIFSVLDAVLLRPLPFDEPSRLAALWELDENGNEMRVAYPNFLDWQRQSESFSAMAVYSGPARTTVTGGDEPVRASRVVASADFFAALGVRPRLGRFFSEEETRPGADRSAVVSYGFWDRVLGAPADLDGVEIRIENEPHRLIGVLPAGQAFPEDGEIWTPKEVLVDGSTRTAHNHRLVARLAEGVELDAARAELSAIAQRLAQEYAGENDARGVAVLGLREQLVGSARTPLWLLLAAAGLVLLVACANLASSLLARAVGRQREIAVRSAMGAGRGGIVRQLLTESLVLTLTGGVLGIGVAWLALEATLRLAPPSIPRLDTVAIDPRVMLFALAAAVLAGALVALAPVASLIRTEISEALSEGDRGAAGTTTGWVWNTLIAGEVALSVVLLISAGLLVSSIRQILDAPLGYEIENRVALEVTAPVDVPPWEGDDFEPLRAVEGEIATFWDGFLEEMRTTPGVRRASLVSSGPLQGMSTTLFYFDDRPEDETGAAGYLVTGPEYFATLGIPLLRGRLFDERDRAGREHVAVVSQSLAERYWPGDEALGKRIRPPGMDLWGDRFLRIVGVVGDVRQRSVTSEPYRTMYVPYAQRAFGSRWSTVVLETEGPAEALFPTLRERVRSIQPDLPVTLRTLESVLQRSISRQRFQTLVLSAFAALALLLAASGIWAVVAYQVVQRSRELGVRIALGATPRRLVLAVLRRTVPILLVGVAVGYGLALALGRLLESLLYEIQPTDLRTLVAVGVLFLGIGALAAIVPALRATRVDPIVALRSE